LRIGTDRCGTACQLLVESCWNLLNPDAFAVSSYSELRLKIRGATTGEWAIGSASPNNSSSGYSRAVPKH
jgi:hypothetical protein